MEQSKMTAVVEKQAYGKLLSEKLPHVISSKKDYDEMRELAKELIIAKKRTAAETELLKLVGVLIDQWQSRQPRLPKAGPTEILEYLMEEHSHRAADLCDAGIADKGTLSKILSKKIKISNEIAMRLAKFYKTDPTLFITFER